MDSSQPLENIKRIRSIMERSTTFISLSGLSGLAAGGIGLVSVGLAMRELGGLMLSPLALERINSDPHIRIQLVLIFAGALIAALLSGAALTARKAARNDLSIWNNVSRRFAFHLFVPLLAGGLFILALGQAGLYQFICPAMLLFFGLALVGSGHLTIAGTTILGVVEVVLGLAAAFWTQLGLVMWGLGFGLATAVYGLVLHLRYER